MAHDSDNAWKGILDGHFKDCLRFFFPAVHDAVDWRTRPVFADKELAKLIPEALKGKALADKLVKVRLRTGKRALVFLHVEVQGWSDPAFALRMFRYNVLIRERHGDEVVSLAVLTDANPRFRPSVYEHSQWGFLLRMEFPVVKLLDYRGREEELAASTNPFAVVALAHLARLGASDGKRRFDAKLGLVRLLYRRGHTLEEIQALLRFLDWILRLPEDLERKIMDVTETLEHGKRMPFLSNIERWSIEKGLEKGLEKGRQKGLVEGLQEGIAIGLRARFGAEALEVMPRVRKIQSAPRLRGLLRRLQTSRSLATFRASLGRK